MTTHVALTARAFDADKMFITDKDSRVEKTINDVTDRFGGDFEIVEKRDWKGLISDWKGDVVHLTMYGEDIDGFFGSVALKDPLIIVGAEKVPGDVYRMSDYNVAVGNQPHSEVAALAIFMDRFNERKVKRDYPDARISVMPCKGKKRILDYSKIPTIDECYGFCVEKGMDEDLMKHTLSVLERAFILQYEHGGDLKLVIAGAMLHDIGRTISHGPDHGVVGAKIVREQGWDEELAKIVERHVGGGISKEEAEEQGLPSKDMIPETIEEKIVCHADNTAGGRERFEELIHRTRSAGYQNSADRMDELAEFFKKK